MRPVSVNRPGNRAPVRLSVTSDTANWSGRHFRETCPPIRKAINVNLTIANVDHMQAILRIGKAHDRYGVEEGGGDGPERNAIRFGGCRRQGTAPTPARGGFNRAEIAPPSLRPRLRLLIAASATT